MILVASYCRVSMDKEDQANSFEAQQRYFREYIDRQPDWEPHRVYANEGITGTSTKKRAEFNRMISDAKMGKFQLILTKEESRKTSTRVKWGQTRQMERGVVFGRSMLGYDVKDGKMTVNPQGAKLVRLIFHKYGIEHKGTSVIARELREAGTIGITAQEPPRRVRNRPRKPLCVLWENPLRIVRSRLRGKKKAVPERHRSQKMGLLHRHQRGGKPYRSHGQCRGLRHRPDAPG